MSLLIVLIIMVVAGILGGIVNYLLPANANAETGTKIRGVFSCIVLGFGATFLVPLFLEIAQSKLLDKMHPGFHKQACPSEKPKDDTTKSKVVYLKITMVDSPKGKNDTLVLGKAPVTTTKSEGAADKNTKPDSDNDPLKGYLLYGAYCLLAAASGFKFINMLINNVVKEKELNDKTNKIETLEKDKEKREKNSQISQQQEEMKVRQDAVQTGFTAAAVDQDVPALFWPVLPPVIHPDDPQKGRFGGKSGSNGRELIASVTESFLPGYYNVDISVESTDPLRPLNNEVVLYLHDSFSPSVFSIKPEDFKNGKAVYHILSWGAFTIGAITDNGKTMLELDMAEDARFPREFRDR